MNFRTEIDSAPLTAPIGYSERLLALGSCFTEHIGKALLLRKFRITINPGGILFNPFSIADAIQSYATPTPVVAEELLFDGERYCHYGFHGDLSAPTAEEALRRMNDARQMGATALRQANRLLLTFGTAWIYEHRGQTVANCHRQAASEFARRRLTVEEIVERYEELLRGALRGKRIVLTVSPVRHIGDTLAGNAVSKATLRLAAETLAERHPEVEYFPAYEILTDDLRDYRFYADDLVHPSSQALAYLWEQFARLALDEAAQRLQPEVEAIVAAAAHRPRNPQSEAHRTFCQRMLERIARLPGLDFREESGYFRRCIEINS